MILLLGLGLNGCMHLLPRAGSTDLLDVEYLKLKYRMKQGVCYLDDNQLRKLIH